MTYQMESVVSYELTDKASIGVSGNYIEALEGKDYSARMVLILKLK
jgi:hypothetical protein